MISRIDIVNQHKKLDRLFLLYLSSDGITRRKLYRRILRENAWLEKLLKEFHGPLWY